MKTLYNIFAFNYSTQLSRKEFAAFSIVPLFIIIVASANVFFTALMLPNILLILYIFSIASLYRLNHAGINKSISFIIIMLFILLFSSYISATFPTSSFTNEWSEYHSDLIQSAQYKLGSSIFKRKNKNFKNKIS